MNIAFVRPGHDATKAHLQPGAYLEQCAAHLRRQGHFAAVGGVEAVQGAQDAIVWCVGPTSMLRQPASRIRATADRVVAFVPGPVYGLRDLSRGLGPHLLRAPADHAVHLAGAAMPRRALVRHLLAAADETVVPTPTLARQLAAAGHPPGRLHVIPPGLDAAVPETADRRAARAVLTDWGVGAPFVVNFGPVRPVRGVDTLLAAAPLLPPDLSVLVLARPGDGRPERDLVWLGRKGIDPRVAVRSEALGRPALLGLVSLAHVAAFPLRLVQSVVPLAIVEALQLGTPVVSTDMPPLPDLVRPPHGATFAPGDHVGLARTVAEVSARHDDASRAALGWAGARATWDETARRWAEVLA